MIDGSSMEEWWGRIDGVLTQDEKSNGVVVLHAIRTAIRRRDAKGGCDDEAESSIE